MKKLSIVALSLLVAGAVSNAVREPSLEKDSISLQQPLTLKAKVSSPDTAVIDTNLSYALVHILNVGVSNPNVTNIDITLSVLGDSLTIVSVPETNFTDVVTNQVLAGTLYWVEIDNVDPASGGTMKFTSVFAQTTPIYDNGTYFGPGLVTSNLLGVAANQASVAAGYHEKTNDVIAWTAGTTVDGSTVGNSTLFVSGSSSDGGSNSTAKVTGIWEDGVSTVSGTVDSTKEKRGTK